MPDFDPYYEWLGIPPKDQPAHHYRLLGVELFEEHRSAIDAAANRLMAYLQELSNGEDAALAQKLLNEVSAARVCLLNAEQKSIYDRKLKAHLQKKPAQVAGGDLPVATPLRDKTAPTPPPVPTAQIIADSHAAPQISTEQGPVGPPSTTSRRTSRRGKNNESKVLFAVIALLLVAAGTLVYFYTKKPAKELPAKNKNSVPVVGNNRSTKKSPEINQETITTQARDFAHSVARNAGKSGPDTVEICDIAALLASPYWQQLAKKKTTEQQAFYEFVAQQAIQLLMDGHSLTQHELNFRKLPGSTKQRPPPGSNQADFNKYLEQLSQRARQDYRTKYTQEFDKEAEQRLGIQEE